MAQEHLTHDDTVLTELRTLCHALGDPAHDWAILGEGNASALMNESRFYVKASGAPMASLDLDELVSVRFAPLIDALHSNRVFSDAETKELLIAAGESGRRQASVETFFHAGLLSLPGVRYVGHTHVTSINSLLCSASGWAAMLRNGRLFPDEVVVCGVAPCCVPYVDPGIPLARTVLAQVNAYISERGVVPKTVYLRNHGFIAIGASPAEVVAITAMADKAARILLGTMAFDGPSFLTQRDVSRIYTRPDEEVRRIALGLAAAALQAHGR